MNMLKKLTMLTSEAVHRGIEDGFTTAEYSPSGCNDRVVFGLKLDNEKLIARYEHKGCMLSEAVAELLARKAEELGIEKAGEIGIDFLVEELGENILARPNCVEAALIPFQRACQELKKQRN